ncbi:MAG: hypothetical protein QOF76_1882 [Solirubrobacteraceae bacterium]|nr:hypothetical protein [Solirubrobacteraceae bacterium]
MSAVARRGALALLLAGCVASPLALTTAPASAQSAGTCYWNGGYDDGCDAPPTPTPAATVKPAPTVKPGATVAPTASPSPGAGGVAPTAPGGTTPSPLVLPSPTPVVPTPTPAAALPAVKGRFVSGRIAQLRRNGKAAIPSGAPKRVQAIIAMANRIIGLPYKWGGGHAVLDDKGYDCSGTVSFALIKAGQLAAPLVSGDFATWGEADVGRWVTIYANKDHVYMEVAGLRLDTSAVGDPTGLDGVRWRPAIGERPKFTVRHPVGL